MLLAKSPCLICETSYLENLSKAPSLFELQTLLRLSSHDVSLMRQGSVANNRAGSGCPIFEMFAGEFLTEWNTERRVVLSSSCLRGV